MRLWISAMRASMVAPARLCKICLSGENGWIRGLPLSEAICATHFMTSSSYRPPRKATGEELKRLRIRSTSYSSEWKGWKAEQSNLINTLKAEVATFQRHFNYTGARFIEKPQGREPIWFTPLPCN